MNLSDNRRIEYLTASDLYNLNDEVTGGHTYVRDVHLLNSAAKRPAIVVFGEEQFPTLIDKAAALLHSLAYHHLFADGNKRTALRAVTLFLEKNGYVLTWDDRTEYDLLLEIAQGKYDVEQIAERLTPYVAEEQN
jgi:death-on-curing protein